MMNLVFRLLVSSILERLDILCFKIADLKSIVLLVFFSLLSVWQYTCVCAAMSGTINSIAISEHFHLF